MFKFIQIIVLSVLWLQPVRGDSGERCETIFKPGQRKGFVPKLEKPFLYQLEYKGKSSYLFVQPTFGLTIEALPEIVRERISQAEHIFGIPPNPTELDRQKTALMTEFLKQDPSAFYFDYLSPEAQEILTPYLFEERLQDQKRRRRALARVVRSAWDMHLLPGRLKDAITHHMAERSNPYMAFLSVLETKSERRYPDLVIPQPFEKQLIGYLKAQRTSPFVGPRLHSLDLKGEVSATLGAAKRFPVTALDRYLRTSKDDLQWVEAYWQGDELQTQQLVRDNDFLWSVQEMREVLNSHVRALVHGIETEHAIHGKGALFIVDTQDFFNVLGVFDRLKRQGFEFKRLLPQSR